MNDIKFQVVGGGGCRYNAKSGQVIHHKDWNELQGQMGGTGPTGPAGLMYKDDAGSDEWRDWKSGDCFNVLCCDPADIPNMILKLKEYTQSQGLLMVEAANKHIMTCIVPGSKLHQDLSMHRTGL